MNIQESVKSVLSKYVTFSGRASRSEYWWFIVALILAYVVVAIVGGAVSEQVGGVLYLIVALGTFLPALAVLIRRLHDVDRSGWWILIQLIPLVGPILLIVWLASRGTAGANRFGADPLAA